MKRIICLLLCTLLVLPTLFLFGCAKEEKVIRVCNCEDYIDESLFEEFEAKTGIRVEYSTYGTNENLYNELVINPNSYDLVVPSEYMIQKLAAEGRINKLDLSKVEGYEQNVSQYIQRRLENIKFTVQDGEHKGEQVALSDFMVGYMWGTMGWVYNTDVVSESDVCNWENVFNNPALRKKTTIKDAVRDSYLVGLAMVYKDQLESATTNEQITEILNRVDQRSIELVGQKLEQLKPFLYGFEVDSGKNDIILGNIDAYVAWSGDAAYAIDVAAGDAEDEDGTYVEDVKSLSYYIPDEGSNIWFDGFVMPSGSDNYDAVYEFLSFISSPESVYRNMDETGYTGIVSGGEFTMTVENEDGEEEQIQTTLFEQVVLEWFDESEDLEDGQGISVDLSYFFGDDGDYTVVVSEESYGRLIAQYPTAEQVSRCAIMNYFENDTLVKINEMWEGVKGETFPTWALILIVVFVVLLAVFILLYRNREKFRWFKLPQRKTTYAERKGLSVVKVEEIDLIKKHKKQ